MDEGDGDCNADFGNFFDFNLSSAITPEQLASLAFSNRFRALIFDPLISSFSFKSKNELIIYFPRNKKLKKSVVVPLPSWLFQLFQVTDASGRYSSSSAAKLSQ